MSSLGSLLNQDGIVLDCSLEPWARLSVLSVTCQQREGLTVPSCPQSQWQSLVPGSAAALPSAPDFPDFSDPRCVFLCPTLHLLLTVLLPLSKLQLSTQHGWSCDPVWGAMCLVASWCSRAHIVGGTIPRQVGLGYMIKSG